MTTAEMDVEDHPDSKNGKTEGGSPPVEGKNTDRTEAPPNCLAQADVSTPWLDINARFQLRSHGGTEKPKKEKSHKSARPLSFFSLPRLRPKRNAKGKIGAEPGHDKVDEERASAETNSSEQDDASKDTNDASSITGWPELIVPKKRKIWQGWEGLAVSTFGIALPSLVFAMSVLSMPKRLTLVILNHPLETIAELLLLISIPVANYIAWSAICRNDWRYSLRRGIALGSACMSSLLVMLICIASLFTGNTALTDAIGSDFSFGFLSLATIGAITACVTAYLVNRVRLSRDFKNSRLQVLAYTAVGAVLAVCTLFGAEFRPWSIRLAEKKASSSAPVERIAGLAELRALEPERELLMECSDDKAAGLPGLFIPIKNSMQKSLYFALTGKPYSFKDISNANLSSMPDDYLSRHVVGEKVEGLTLSRSYLSGNVHAKTLSSTIEWTYVFKNDSKEAMQEARAEIGLPPGAVITGLKLWRQGEPTEATFAASGKAEGANGFTAVGHDSPAIITDLGRGRALLHCYPVTQTEEVKLQLTMVVPLKADGDRAATLALPKFIASNFNLQSDNLLKLKSETYLSSSVKDLRPTTSAGGLKAITGSLTAKQMENSSLLLSAARPANSAPVVVLDRSAIKLEQQDIRAAERRRRKKLHDNHKPQEQVVVMIDGSKGIQSQFENLRKVMAMKAATGTGKGKADGKKKIKTIPPKYVVEKVVRTAAPAPKELVIVIDGSVTMKDHIGNLLKALNKMPKGIPAHVIVASQEHTEMVNPTPLKDALNKLPKIVFAGGQDNLQAVVKASELAGETKGGAVLWVHGPLPVLNEECYIMPPYVATPAFFELPLGSGETDTFDFFKNHSEIGPFQAVPRNTTEMVDDVASFFSKWKSNQNGYAVSLEQTSSKPEHSVMATDEEAKELLALHANRQVGEFLNTRHITRAARFAVEYGFVSPVSCALVSDSTEVEDLDAAENTEPPASTEQASDKPESTADSSETNTDSSGDAAADADGAYSHPSTPSLQGATNGSVGQGTDATFITGVNTAGTVRVNNLANLEAMLNIIANLLEIGCGLVGAIVIIHSLSNKSFALDLMGQELEISQGQRIAIGVALLLFGLAFPGLLNWFVASARDANLFS